jgi:hypothetical protein
MPIMFNNLLLEAGISLSDVRLLRHKDRRAAKGRSPYELWRDDRQQLELYQSTHSIEKRAKLNASYWASFVEVAIGMIYYSIRRSATWWAG